MFRSGCSRLKSKLREHAVGSGEEHSGKKQWIHDKLCSRHEPDKLEKLMLSGLEESSRRVNVSSIHICFSGIKTLTPDGESSCGDKSYLSFRFSLLVFYLGNGYLITAVISRTPVAIEQHNVMDIPEHPSRQRAPQQAPQYVQNKTSASKPEPVCTMTFKILLTLSPAIVSYNVCSHKEDFWLFKLEQELQEESSLVACPWGGAALTCSEAQSALLQACVLGRWRQATGFLGRWRTVVCPSPSPHSLGPAERMKKERDVATLI